MDHDGPLAQNGDIEVYLVIYPANSSAPIDVTGTWSVTLTGSIINVGTFDAWIVCGGVHCDFDGGDDELTVGEPGVAADAITVGSYTTKPSWTSTDGTEYCFCPPPTAGEISSFSSRGPTRDSRQKPDITAPGEVIASSLSSNASEVAPLILPDNVHSIKQGTSMATPHVAGAVALLLAENPTLDAAEIKALLQSHAVLDGFTSGACDNTWGCGRLNIANISFGDVGAPALTAPAGGATLATARPLFDWEPATGDVTDYRLVVSGDSPVLDVVVTHPTTAFEATGDMNDGPYSWRVTATDGGPNQAHSETRTFTIDTTPPGAPILEAPTDQALINDSRPLFDWTTSSGDVVEYRLVVSGNAPVLDVMVDHPTTMFQVTGDLADGTYTWRVTARDSVLNQAHSETRSLTIDAVLPGAPSLVAPADEALINDSTPLFDWSPSTGDVADYRLQVTSGDVDSDPYDVDVMVLHPASEFQPTGDLPDGPYSWRVTARDSTSNQASSETRSFTIDTIPPEAPTLIFPASGDSVAGEFDFTWDTTAEAGVLYAVYLSSGDGGGGPFDVLTGDLDTGRLTIHSGDLSIGATYRWRVTAADSAGNTADSGIVAFNVITNDWTATLAASALLGGLPLSGGGVLQLGVTPGATGGFDPGLDIPAPPSSTGGASILPHLLYPGNDPGPPNLRLLATNIVAPEMPQEWQLRVTASGDSGDTFQVSLVWDISAIPDNFKEVRLYGSGDGMLLADMRTTGGYTFQATINGTGVAVSDFRVRVGRFETQTLAFRTGWNLIALTVDPLDASPAQVLKDLETFSIFEWMAGNQAYGVPQLLAGRAGYWVAVFQEAEITFEGAAVGPYVATVEKGWNLVGGTLDEATMEAVSGGQVGASMFRWDPALQRYVSTTTMAPGFGHWLAAFDVATILVSPLGG